jgi:hypothetical protein
MVYPQKKGHQSIVELIVKEGLKVSSLLDILLGRHRLVLLDWKSEPFYSKRTETVHRTQKGFKSIA